MNSLSWTLLLAGVLPNIAAAVGFVSAIASIGLLMTIIAYCCQRHAVWELAASWRSRYPNEEHTARALLAANEYLQFLRRAFFFLPVTLLIFFSSFLVPGEKTFYMIAASQAGGEVLQSPEADKLRAIINQYLDKAQAPVSQ